RTPKPSRPAYAAHAWLAAAGAEASPRGRLRGALNFIRRLCSNASEQARNFCATGGCCVHETQRFFNDYIGNNVGAGGETTTLVRFTGQRGSFVAQGAQVCRLGFWCGGV